MKDTNRVHNYDVDFDFMDPDYVPILELRNARIEALSEDEKFLKDMKEFYRTKPWEFVNDWGWTFEPRNIEIDRPAKIPFILFPRQIEFLKWMYARWRDREPGLCEKSRDCGVTWLFSGLAVSMLLFQPGFITGVGSRKEDLVDNSEDEKSIFHKIRFFMDEVPDIFKPPMYHSAKMRMSNPTNGAGIFGEAGVEIGRGGRSAIYLVDESAHVQNQDRMDRALSANTNCQIDVSSVNGPGNAFYRKRHRYKDEQIFIFDWKSDPRKNQAWYDHQVANKDEETVAQEIDRDYAAAQVDAFLPAKWVAACIDAHITLGFEPMGVKVTGFDPADVGDSKAIVNRHGSVVTEAEQLKSGDITVAIPWAMSAADDHRSSHLLYDADGMGAPAMKLAMQQRVGGRIVLLAYHGSAGVQDPAEPARLFKKKRQKFRQGQSALMGSEDEKTNADTYQNFLAQSWGWVRQRMYNTFVAVSAAREGKLVNADPGDLISISSGCKDLLFLQAELSTPKRKQSGNGKWKRESKVEMRDRGVESPNLADAFIINLSFNDAILVAGTTKKMKKKPKPGFEQSMKDPGAGF